MEAVSDAPAVMELIKWAQSETIVPSPADRRGGGPAMRNDPRLVETGWEITGLIASVAVTE